MPHAENEEGSGLGARSQTHSPQSPGVAVVSLLAVGGTLILTLLIANTQSTEIGFGVSPGGTALAEEFVWTGGRMCIISCFGAEST